MALDWLIIGGGIHGVHIAARLLGESGVAPERLRIVDPGDRLLAHWRSCAATTGMTHLRSPGVHHLDLDPFSLLHFAGKRKKRKHRKTGLFAPPYDRPALALFNAHCDRVVETFGLANLHIQDRATKCSVDRDGVGVQLSSGREIAAQHLVLAIGASEQPEWPDWAPRSHARVHHVFEPGFDGWPSSSETVVVIGGGISAGQVALRLATHSGLEAERVLLATGFASTRPGGSMVDALIASASLPCAHCGYPIVDSALRWHPRIHVSGPLAELELGPASRNIAGARLAGDRLVKAARARG